MGYPRGNFGYCSFSRFGFIVRTNRETDTETDTHTDADDRYIHAASVGLSNKPRQNMAEVIT